MPITKPFPNDGEAPWGAKIREWATEVETEINGALPAADLDAAAAALLANPESEVAQQQAATFVVVRNHDGTPITPPKVVVLTLTEDGTDIDDIAVYDSIEEVGA